MHPLVIVLLALIALGLLQRLGPAKKESVQLVQRFALGVLLVAPAKADVEARLSAMLRLCAHPNRVRFYVAKVCGAGESAVDINDTRLRLATRIQFVRARHSKPERLRATLVGQVLEPYLLCTCWHHEVEWGWDDMLVQELKACRDTSAVLTGHLVSRAKDASFPHLDTLRERTVVGFAHTAFAVPPSSPQPAIVCSTQLLFGPTLQLQEAWPARSDVEDAHEDATLTAFLWMRGLRFYCPHNQPLYAEVGHEPREVPGRLVLPTGHTHRTRDEFWASIGVRNGRMSSRSRAGLTLRASASERYHKVGQSLAVRRDIS